MRRRWTALATGALLLAGSLTGCGLDVNAALPFDIRPGSIKPVPELAGVDITVGSKAFTENTLLGYMAEMALSAAGAHVIDLTGIQGSNSARQALVNDQLNMYYEYTGTAWISYQGNTEPIPDERGQFDAVAAADARQGLTWLDYSPVNDTYAFATTQAFAQQNHLKTNSDMTAFLKAHPNQASYCLETEFASRQDGFPGARKAYGFPEGNVKIFGIGAIYASIADGSCNFGEIFSTDGRIAGLHLTVLQDDKKFFPQYNAAPTVRTDFLAAHPQLRQVLAPISAAIDNQQMIQLCEKVDVEGQDAGKVAHDWMVSKGFIT